MAVPKPTMKAIDWEPQLAALDATLKEIQQEAERISKRIQEVQKENEAIDQEIEEILTRK
jgi:predicted  nucleic acid-binding Zn-ribbon protein